MRLAMVLAAAITCMGAPLGTADASPRGGAIESDIQAPGVNFERLDVLSQSLSPDQQRALAQVEGESVEAIMGALEGIFTARQMAAFQGSYRSVEFDAPESEIGAVYLSGACWSSSKVGLLLSLVGYIGCPGGVARDATVAMWEASNFSGVCLIAGEDSCPDAVASAGNSADLWETLLGSCSVADSAYYSAYITYRTCGGDRDTGEEPTPTPTDGEPTPTMGEPTPGPTPIMPPPPPAP